MQNSAKLQSTKQTNLDPLITTFSGSDAQHTNTCWDSTQSVDWWWKTNGFVSLWDLPAPTKTKKTWEAENESGEKRETFGPRLAANLTTSVSHYPSVHRFSLRFLLWLSFDLDEGLRTNSRPLWAREVRNWILIIWGRLQFYIRSNDSRLIRSWWTKMKSCCNDKPLATRTNYNSKGLLWSSYDHFLYSLGGEKAFTRMANTKHTIWNWPQSTSFGEIGTSANSQWKSIWA